MRRSTLLAYLAGAAALSLNPFYACSGNFDFGLADVAAALDGEWTATWTRADAPPETVAFRVDVGVAATRSSAGLVPAAAACGKRALVRPAGACVDETEVPLRFVPRDGIALTGTFWIFGSSFREGSLTVKRGDLELEAYVSSTGVVTGVKTSEPGVTATLVHAAAVR